MVIDAYIEKRKFEDKQSKITIYNQAYLTSLFVGSVIGGKSIPPIDKVFPELKPEPQEVNQSKTMDRDSIILKERMIDFANEANKRRRNK